MRRLLVADVHANLPAFEAVLGDAGEVDEVAFAGDVVGFGPHPTECVELLRSLEARAVAGNHDLEVLAASAGGDAPGRPINWLQWTRAQLSGEHLSYIRSLPEECAIPSIDGNDISLLHHPPGAPYLHPAMPDAVLARHCRTADGAFVVFGHSHRLIDRVIDGRRLVCLPPVGQPRDGDPRAGYALQTDGALSFHRVGYDVESVVADVRGIGLDAAFTARWVAFLRTGFDEEWSRPYRPG